jgi:NADH-quinone oxidoreductase subunit L
VTTILTGFYTGRMWWIAFWGRPSATRPVAQPREAPSVMLVPVVVLAVLTAVGGLLQMKTVLGVGTTLVEDYLQPVLGAIPWPANPAEFIVTIATVILALVAFLYAYLMYVPLAERRAGYLDVVAEVAMAHPEPWSGRLAPIQALLEHKYYFDELYDLIFVRPLDRLAGWGQRGPEQGVIDRSLAGIAAAVEDGATGLSLAENGYFRSYILVFVAGGLVAGLLVLWRANV